MAVSNVEQSLQELPDRWMAPVLDRMPLQLVGAGLGLLGLRTIPLVGRASELNTMWVTLLEADEQRQVRAVVLEGDSGAGRSRLGEALVQRVRELGVATVLRLTHTQGGSSTDGISGMLARHFRTLRANPADLLKVVKSGLSTVGMTSAYDVQAMATLCEEAHVGARPLLEFSNTRQRHTLLVSWLRHLSAKRPVLIWADDLHMSQTSTEFLKALLKERYLGPVMFIGAWKNEDADVAAADLLESVRNDLLVLEVPALSAREQREMVQNMVPIASELTFEICERAAGNPRFAVELITDWVNRGLFEVSASGFRPRADVTLEIPASLQEIWRERITAVTQGDLDKLVSLQLAASLGLEVHSTEWELACRAEGVRGDASLLTALIGAGLAEVTHDGWRFEHPMLRDALEQSAREANKWSGLKLTCAAVLKGQGDESVDVSERLGRYLVDGERPQEALPHLWRAAEARRRQGQFIEAQQDITWVLRAVESLEDPELHTARAHAMRARTYLNASEPRNALTHAQTALDLANGTDDDVTVISAMTWRAMARQMLGDRGAADDIAQAYDLATSSPASLPHQTYTSLAFMLSTQRRLEDAVSLLDAASKTERTAADQAMELQHRSRLAVLQGQWTDVLRLGQQALEELEQVGHFQAMTSVMEYIAEAHRKLGDLEAAKALLERCIDLQTSVGSPTVFSHANLGSVALALGRYEEAEAHYLQALHGGRAVGRRMVIVCALGGLMATAACLERWSQAADLVTTVRIELQNGMIPEPDLGIALEIAGDQLSKESVSDAAGAYDLSIAVFQSAGMQARADEVKQKCDDLDVLGWDFPVSSEVREEI